MAPTVRKKKKPSGKVKDTIGKVLDLDEHPFFVKKAQEAKAFIEKHGLPD